MANWLKIATVTATGNETTMTTGTIDTSSYLHLQAKFFGIQDTAESAIDDLGYRFNGTTTETDYDYRTSLNGASDVVATGQTILKQDGSSAVSGNRFMVSYISNVVATQKMVLSNICLNDVSRCEGYGFYDNTTSIDEIEVYNSTTDAFATDSQLVIFGSE